MQALFVHHRMVMDIIKEEAAFSKLFAEERKIRDETVKAASHLEKGRKLETLITAAAPGRFRWVWGRQG